MWPGLETGQRLLLATRLVASRFAEHGILSLRELLTETHDELRRDPEHAGSDGLVAVVARC